MLVVAPRILRRVIKQDSGVGGIGLRVPHRKTYVVARDRLLSIVARDELDLAADAELPEQVILIARPSGEMLAELSPDESLLKYWRQLFHARVHFVLEERIAAGRLGEADVRSRIRQIGVTEFEEIRSVLRQEEYLLPPRTDLSVYVEFVAVYLELRCFVPSFLRSYFPSLEDFHKIDEILRQDVDSESLLSATRPAGAPHPMVLADVPNSQRVVERLDEAQPLVRPVRVPARRRSNRLALVLSARAEHVARLGNLVRAANLRTRAARLAKSDLSASLREQARADLGRLVQRLQAALNFTDNEADEWIRSLHALLDLSARGVWTTEARMLVRPAKGMRRPRAGHLHAGRVRLDSLARPAAAEAVSARAARRVDVQTLAFRVAAIAGRAAVAPLAQPAGGITAIGSAPGRSQPAGPLQARGGPHAG